MPDGRALGHTDESVRTVRERLDLDHAAGVDGLRGEQRRVEEPHRPGRDRGALDTFAAYLVESDLDLRARNLLPWTHQREAAQAGADTPERPPVGAVLHGF